MKLTTDQLALLCYESVCYPFVVGLAILTAAAFQAAFLGEARSFVAGDRRLKAGGSQDWLAPLYFLAS
jgi:hypothetical protein